MNALSPGPSPGPRAQAKPGGMLKALRTQKGWTLAEVSRRTGMTVSALSKVENDKMALTFDKLVRLSEGLGVDIAQFFGSAESDAARTHGGGRRSIARAGEGQSIEVDRGRYLYVAADLLKKRMTPIIGEVFARDISEYDEYQRHSGEEYVYVLEGVLDLFTDTYTAVRLEQGESIYFDSSMGHAYVKVGDTPCRILSVCATPDAQMIEALSQEAERGRISGPRTEEPVPDPKTRTDPRDIGSGSGRAARRQRTRTS